MKLVYPACFYEEKEGGYSVVFPDLKGCITQGETLQEAIEMAEDAALGWLLDTLEDGQELPMPSKLKNVKLENENGFINLLLLDLGSYSEKYSHNRYVKKTLTIPHWLNELAERKKVNFSRTLQEALLQKTFNVKKGV